MKAIVGPVEILCRYVDLPRLLSILDRKAFFPSVAQLSPRIDPFEGELALAKVRDARAPSADEFRRLSLRLVPDGS
jgi:hypothetical protein